MKWILILLVAGSGFFSGLLKYQGFENRIRDLNDLLTLFHHLRSEMEYRKDPLPILLRRTGKENANLAQKFAVQIAENLSEKQDFPEAWNSAMNQIYSESNSFFLSKDREILSEAGNTLGTTDWEDQYQFFSRLENQLSECIVSAEEEKEKKGKVWRSLLWAGTIVSVILLI